MWVTHHSPKFEADCYGELQRRRPTFRQTQADGIHDFQVNAIKIILVNLLVQQQCLSLFVSKLMLYIDISCFITCCVLYDCRRDRRNYRQNVGNIITIMLIHYVGLRLFNFIAFHFTF